MAQTFGQWLLCLKHYVLMCFFLSSPERLPNNPHCTLISILGYFLIGLLLVDKQRGYSEVSSVIMLELVMLAIVAWTGLKWKKLLPRYQQTFSALVGINLVITAVALPIMKLLIERGVFEADSNSLLEWTPLIIDFWNLTVLSLIFKRALDITTTLSAMISFNFYLVFTFIVVWFF